MERARRVVMGVARMVARALWLSTLVILPLFGMWLASSLASYNNASRWLALGIGLLLFPIVPVAWDLVFRWRMRGHPDRKRFLTAVDRLVLRTVIVNVLFAGGLLWQRPVAVYKALSVRGDWMLDGYDGPTANWLRGGLFTVADWFRRGWSPATGAERYGESDRAPSQPPPPPSEPVREVAPELDEPSEPSPDQPTPVDEPPPAPPVDTSGWPMPQKLDPIVTAMPAEDQASIATIGAYLAAHIPDERQRIKAVHDVVIIRLSYDDQALADITAHRYDQVPSMEAEAVFARRTGVCEGYARLMTALGEAAGVEIAYVTGVARGSQAPALDGAEEASLEGNGHAWNAARVGDHWYPIDATWDDGEDQYETTYLFTPPEVFIRDHLPEDDGWQLLASPISFSDFLRQPSTTANFAALGLQLRSPNRSQVSVEGSIALEIANPAGVTVMATISPATAPTDDRSQDRECGTSEGDRTVRLRCNGLAEGAWRVDLYAGPRRAKSLDYGGSIWVNSR